MRKDGEKKGREALLHAERETEGGPHRRQKKSTSKERIQDGDSKIERMKGDAVVCGESQMDYELQQ